VKFLAIDLNHPAHYLNFGVLSVSVGNLIMISAVVVLFVLALALPFPEHDSSENDSSNQKMDRE
jgi:hypothetical protein